MSVTEHHRRYRATKRDWAQRNRTISRAQSRKASDAVKAAIRAFVLGVKSQPCMDCRQTFDPICMDFDHRVDEVKVKNVSQLRTLDDVKAEVTKCDVVCSNCHRLRTKRRAQWGPKSKTAKAATSLQLSLLEEEP